MSAQHVSLSAESSTGIFAESAADAMPSPAASAEAWAPAAFGTAVAAEIAQLVVAYWQDGRAHADINPERPVDVIDLAPGNGYNGHQLIRALQAATRHTGGMRFRYLPVIPGDAWMSRACAAPEMQAYRQQGWLLPLVGPPQMPSQLTADGRAYTCDNPVVILAHDGWSRLPQRLLAVHYGKLLEADLALIHDQQAGTTERPDWRAVEPGLQSGAFAPVFARYLDEFNSTPICYPEGAIDALRRWRRVTRHGYLMLTTGTGTASELRMRLHTFPDLVSTYRDEGRLPVHYGLLAHWARLHGAATVEQDLPDGQAMQIVMEVAEGAPERLAALADRFDPTIYSRQSLMAEAMRSVGGERKLEHLRQLLRLSGHDPVLLADMGRELALGFSKSMDFDRIAWRIALDEVWANFLPELAAISLHDRLANAAMHCGHWPLAREALLRGMHHHGTSATDLANLAWCEMRTGQLAAGLIRVREALASDPGNALAQQVMTRMQERLSRRDNGWLMELRDEAQHDEAQRVEQVSLTLEPLDLSHADAYFTQYRDPQIAIMTGLPPLKSVEETRQWIKAAPEERGRVSFAVMHREHGFVAYVNLAVSGHAAFFCFWTGVDFQGQGFATAAARRVFRHAAAMGVPLMLTSAYKDNRRSIRALERLGFVRIPSQALPPDQDRVFFVLANPVAGEFDAHQELVDYYRREGLPLKFAGDENGTDSDTDIDTRQGENAGPDAINTDTPPGPLQ